VVVLLEHLEVGDPEEADTGREDVAKRERGERRVAAGAASFDGEAVTVDVSAIAQRHGGGGHPRAAGFSTDLSYDELLKVLCTEVKAELGSS